MSIFDQPIIVVIQEGKAKSQMIADAILAGHRGVVLVEPEEIPKDHFPVVVGAWKTTAHWLHKFRREHQSYVYLDNGYFNAYPHGPYFRATLNGLQLIASDDRAQTADFVRWHDLAVKIKPWRRTGQNILVVLQTAQWFAMMGLDRETWVAHTLSEIDRHTDRPVVIRDKPGKQAVIQPVTTFFEDLEEAHAVVALSSNTLIEATVEGVPVFPMGLCAATPLGNSSLSYLERPWRPDFREPVYRRLAGAQFTLEEMADGRMWQALRAQGNPGLFQDLA